jgi:UDP-hydrolysing UDP-N-acetyl-D-glucosamine 2-epimerase
MMLISWIDAIATFNPDLILYSGDREDVMVASMVSAYMEIPSVHIFSGDHVKDGHVDNPVRHAASKLSSVFFVSTTRHKQRLLKIGEAPDRIYKIGSISLDKFLDHKKCSKEALKCQLGIPYWVQKYAVVIYHPISKEKDHAPEIICNILDSLIENDIYPVVSYPNCDPGNQNIIKKIILYKEMNKIYLYKSLVRETFLSLYKNADFIIGNSSSGIIEAGSIPIPAINVGLRQKGRDAGENVIFCGTSKNEICGAITKSTSSKFLNKIRGMSNLYGDGKSSERAYDLIKQLDFKKFLFKTEDPLDL